MKVPNGSDCQTGLRAGQSKQTLFSIFERTSFGTFAPLQTKITIFCIIKFWIFFLQKVGDVARRFQDSVQIN